MQHVNSPLGEYISICDYRGTPGTQALILLALYQTDKLAALLFGNSADLSIHVPTGAMPTLGPALLAQNTVFSGNPESVSLKK